MMGESKAQAENRPTRKTAKTIWGVRNARGRRDRDADGGWKGIPSGLAFPMEGLLNAISKECIPVG